MLLGTINYPIHHLASNTPILIILVYSYGFDLCTQAALKTNGWKKHEMQCAYHLPIQFSNDQFMVWVNLNLLERRIIGL